MKTPIAVLIALIAFPASAQVSGKAVGTFTPKSCDEPGKALERDFELTVKKDSKPIRLVYAGCSEEGRNDYLSGYTERYYKGADGWGLTLVTKHGDGAYVIVDETKFSEVLVSKGKDFVARFGTIDNSKILSDVIFVEGYAVEAAKKEVPVLKQCEANLPKPVYRGSDLWLLTPTKAYYEREDCDICAELDSCDLKTGEIKEVKLGHLIECSDLDALAKGEKVLYNYCKDGPR